MDARISKAIVANKCFGQSELEYFWLFSSRKTVNHPDNNYHHFQATMPKMLEQKETCDVELKSVFTNWRVGANVIEEDTALHWRLNSVDVLVHECWDFYFNQDGSGHASDGDPYYGPLSDSQATYCIPVASFDYATGQTINSITQVEGEAYFVQGTEIQNQFDAFNHLASSIRTALTDTVIKTKVYPYVTEADPANAGYFKKAAIEIQLWCQSMFTRTFCDGLRDMVTKIHWQPNGSYGINGYFTYGYCATQHYFAKCGFTQTMVPRPGTDIYTNDGASIYYGFVKTRLFWIEFDFLTADGHWTMPMYRPFGTVEKNIIYEVDRKKLVLARLMGFPPTFIMSYSAHQMLAVGKRPGKRSCTLNEPILRDFVSSYIGYAKRMVDAPYLYWKLRDTNHYFCMAAADFIAYPTYNKRSLTPPAPITATFRPVDNVTWELGSWFYDYDIKLVKSNPPTNIPIQPFISVTQYPDGDLSDLFAKTHYKFPEHWSVKPLFYDYEHIRYNSVFIIPFLTPDFYMDDDIIFIRCVTPHATLNYTNESWTNVIAMIPVYNVSVDSSFVVFNTFLDTWTLQVLGAMPYPVTSPMESGSMAKQKINTWYPLNPNVYPRYKTTPPADEGAIPYYSYKEVSMIFAGGNIYVNQIGNYQPFKFLNEFQERTAFTLMPDGEPITSFEIEFTNKYGRKPNVVVFGNKSPETYMNMFLQYADTSYKKSSFRSFAGTRIPFTRNR